MKNLIFLISFFSIINTYGQKTATLWQAKQSNLISVSANWNTEDNHVYGRHLFMRVKNLHKQRIIIIIPPGEITFLSHNPQYQNQMVVKADTMAISANGSDTISLYSVCIGHNKQNPGFGNEFSLVAQEDLMLKDIAQVISQNDYHNTSTAQAAVWSVQGHRPISTVFSKDAAMAWRLARAVSRLSGQALPSHIDLRDHHIVVLNGNFSYQIPKSVIVSLAVYDSSGKVVNRMMDKQLLPTGLHQFKYYANEIADKGSKFWIKLTNDKGEVLYSKEIGENDPDESTEIFSQRIIYPFTLDKGYKDLNLGVYDIQGNLVAEIFNYRHWQIGTHNINYVHHFNRKSDSVFYVRLMTKDNKIVAQKLIRKKGANDDKHPEEELLIQLKYPVANKIENARCVIYNEFGEEIAVVFEGKKLNPGPNEIRYKLKQTYGKKARFTLQLLTPTGQILFCKELIQS
jgi:hypothetical protein